jgi:penicillin G amidase
MRRALAVVGVLAALVLLASLWALVQLRSSLPVLEGTVTASELSASVTVARDAHGAIGYRLVRTFRSELIGTVYDAYTAPMRVGEPILASGQRPRPITSKQADEPVWRLLTDQPAHLVPPGYQSWDAVVDAGIAKTVSAVASQAGGRLGAFTWGAANRAEIRHPLTRAIPGVSLLLNPPNVAQPGDLYQPRVASPTTGASERFVVAPEHEETGIFHMPTSQTGYPLSPYYMIGHEDWVRGQATPFLPGAPQWRMVFQSR